MDSGDTIIAILLGVTILAFVVSHAAERIVQSLRRGPMREKVASGGLRESAARNLWSDRYAYVDLIQVLRLTATAASFPLALALLRSTQQGLGWPVTVASLFGLWAFLLVMRPLTVKLAGRLPDGLLLSLAIPLLLVLWPALPLVRFSYRIMQVGRRTESRMSEEEETVEERISEEPLAPRERRMIGAILGLEDTTVREIMRPRVDVVALDADTPLDQAVTRLVASGHSRVPVFEETLDNVLGVLYARDLLAAVASGQGPGTTVRRLVRPSFFVPESKRIDELLPELQERRVHIGIVIDEYGGVEGIVTIEDLLEEIVGEIEDEFQPAQEPVVQRTEDGVLLVDGRMKLDDFNAEFSTHITGMGFETLAGFLYSKLGRVPNVGDLVMQNGLRLEVASTHGRRIKQVKVLMEQETKKETEGEGQQGGPPPPNPTPQEQVSASS